MRALVHLAGAVLLVGRAGGAAAAGAACARPSGVERPDRSRRSRSRRPTRGRPTTATTPDAASAALTKITAANVKHLSLAWIYDLPAAGTIKATPLQIGGVLYFTTPNHVYAVDARTARELWHYTFSRSRGGIQIGNRGVAMLGSTVYFVTTDCNLVALDIKTGAEKWAKEFCSLEMMYYGSIAPVVVKDKLILGPSGDDLDVPAYLEARSPENGDLIWRWYVTPQKEGDPGLDTWPNLDMAKHGGGMTWQPITYDPELNLIYVTTGNPQPVVAFKNREGANLYTASIVALNADTGKMVWYFQSSPHDTHDWDATQTAVVFDGTINGQPRKLLAQASRNGQFFVLDRTTGKAIVSTEYIKTNWSLGYDEKGQPIPNPEKRPQIAGALVTPNQGGATNWFPPSFSPQTGLFYVNATRAFSVWYIYDASDNPMGWGGTDRGGYAEQPQLKAIDYKTGKIRWSIPRYGGNSGLLTHGRQRPVQCGRRRHRRLQRHDGRAALERAHRQQRDQRADHLRARRPAVRDRRCRRTAGRVRAESVAALVLFSAPR